MRNYLLAVICGLSSLSATASGTHVGNGGDAVVCYDQNKNIKSAELYDFYEARTVRGLKIDLGSPSLSVEKKLALATGRIEKWNTARADLYRGWLGEFSVESQFVTGVDLVPVPDVGVGYVPAGCELKQLAIQKEPTFPGDKRYVVNQDIFNRLDNTNKAGLLLHEVIYREAAVDGAQSSMGVRYYLSILASNGFASMKYRQYIELLKLVQLRLADSHDGAYPFKIFDLDADSGTPVYADIEFYNDNFLKSAPCPEEQYDNFSRKHKVLGMEVTLNDLRDTCESAGQGEEIHFLPNGFPAFIEFLPQKISLANQMTTGQLFASSIAFGENGGVSAISFGPSTLDPGITVVSLKGANLDIQIPAPPTGPNGEAAQIDFTLTFRENGSPAGLNCEYTGKPYPMYTACNVTGKVKTPFSNEWAEHIVAFTRRLWNDNENPDQFDDMGRALSVRFDPAHPYQLVTSAQKQPMSILELRFIVDDPLYVGKHGAIAAQSMNLLSNQGTTSVGPGQQFTFDDSGLVYLRSN